MKDLWFSLLSMRGIDISAGPISKHCGPLSIPGSGLARGYISSRATHSMVNMNECASCTEKDIWKSEEE